MSGPGTTAKKPLSLQGQIACVRREIALRRSTYPRLVNSRRLRQGESDYEIEAMEAVLKSLLWLEHHRADVEAAVAEKRARDMDAQARRMLREL